MKIPRVSIKLVKEENFDYEFEPLTTKKCAGEAFVKLIGNSDREKFAALYLDVKNVPNCIEIISIGSLDTSIVMPREVFKSAILSNSNAIIVAHNHPSGNPAPSVEDELITQKIKEMADCLEIEFIDHLIVGKHCFYSFASKKIYQNKED